MAKIILFVGYCSSTYSASSLHFPIPSTAWQTHARTHDHLRISFMRASVIPHRPISVQCATTQMLLMLMPLQLLLMPLLLQHIEGISADVEVFDSAALLTRTLDEMVNVDPHKVVCSQLPGNYSVHCNNRHLRVFWIPPQDESGNFIRAVPTFREVGWKAGVLHFPSDLYPVVLDLFYGFTSKLSWRLVLKKGCAYCNLQYYDAREIGIRTTFFSSTANHTCNNDEASLSELKEKHLGFYCCSDVINGWEFLYSLLLFGFMLIILKLCIKKSLCMYRRRRFNWNPGNPTISRDRLFPLLTAIMHFWC